METTTKARGLDSCVVKNDDEIDVAYCGPVAEIVAQKLVDLFSSSSSRTSSSHRRISPLKLGEIIIQEEEEEEEEDKDEDKEDNDNAMRTRTTTTPTKTPRVVVIVVETVENDEIAKEGLEVVKILLNASKKKKRNETTKTKSKRRRKYVLVGVGDSRFLAERQYFRSNQNSAEDCNAAARVLDKLLEKSDTWERVGKRLELDYGREFEGKLERWVTSLMMAKDDFP